MTITFTNPPTLPSLSDPANFNDRALGLFSWLTGTFIPELEAVEGLIPDGGDFAVDGDTLYVDVSTNRVGIRTSTPDASLEISRLSGDVSGGMPSVDANTGLIVQSGSGTTGSGAAISIIGGTASTSNGIYFGDPDDGDVGSVLYSHSSDRITFSTNGSVQINISSVGHLYPESDDAQDLGLLAARWDDVYATNGTIQTSDETEKQDIRALTDAEKRVALSIKDMLIAYRWKSAVAEKSDAARTHFGAIAQYVKAALEAEGLNPDDYAFFISGPKYRTETMTRTVEKEVFETVTEQKEEIVVEDGKAIKRLVDVTREVPVYDELPLYDEEGNEIGVHRVLRVEMTEEEYEEEVEDGERLGLRYTELLAFILAAM